MKIKKIITFILLFCLFTYSINIFATSSNVEEENKQTSISENTDEEENINQENKISNTNTVDTSTLGTSPTDTASSRYVTSVKPATTNYEANLGLNNILCIFLITIGILLIILNIAILIKLK